MRIVVAAVGRLKQGPERDLSERYRKRAADAGRSVGFRGVEIIEIRESKAREGDRRILEESIALATVIPEGAVTIVLDERGENLDSLALTREIMRWRDAGRPVAVFVIGGADGLAASLRWCESCCWNRSIVRPRSWPAIPITAARRKNNPPPGQSWP